MTRQAPSQKNATTELERIYRPIRADLEATTDVLKERLRHANATFDGYLEYSFRLGGKRMRPALLLLCAKAWGRVDRRCLLCGAAIEMIHTGSLVHDDILDGARFRRALETVNAKWDSHRAVLIGDMLITRAFDLICECDDSAVFRAVSRFCQSTVEGELMQTDAIGDFNLTSGDYATIVGGKTASLIECATYLGGYLAGARDAALDAFAEIGRALGIAFQIVDDALDLVGDEKTAGKTLGSDLANKKETLPLILFFESASPEAAREMSDWIARANESDARDAVAGLLRESGALARAYAEAERLIDSAIEKIEYLRPLATPTEFGNAAFDSLVDIARFVGARNK